MLFPNYLNPWATNFFEEFTMSDQPFTEEQLRQMFKSFNKFMLLLWRLGLGSWLSFWPEGFGRYMVITHSGRTTGIKRQTPVNYAEVDGNIYCVTGFGEKSDWYKNMMADPHVEIWLRDGWWKGIAEDVTEEGNTLPILKDVLISSGFATPLFEGFDPKTISDDNLADRVKSYRLIRIQRTEACTGPEGPGDLAWVWPAATFLLLPLALRRRKNRTRSY
jgi:deazaflavin-dependent oxidoreductase (nitroreductase family)